MNWGWPRYIPVAEKRRKAEKAIAGLMKKKGGSYSPIKIAGRSIAKTFWGKAWCDHLESFSDYENRLPRGRSYVRNGSVVHLLIDAGRIEALVMGSSLYKIKIDIKSVADQKWQCLSQKCSGQIGSVIELLQGKLSSEVMKTITDRENGLFPLPDEISLDCSCPDWATMCKHVAAVLYGVGARLDSAPELLFKLRKTDHLELIAKVGVKAPGRVSDKARALQDQDLSNLFGIDIEAEKPLEIKADKKPGKTAKKTKAGKSAKKPKAKAARKRKL